MSTFVRADLAPSRWPLKISLLALFILIIQFDLDATFDDISSSNHEISSYDYLCQKLDEAINVKTVHYRVITNHNIGRVIFVNHENDNSISFSNIMSLMKTLTENITQDYNYYKKLNLNQIYFEVDNKIIGSIIQDDFDLKISY